MYQKEYFSGSAIFRLRKIIPAGYVIFSGGAVVLLMSGEEIVLAYSDMLYKIAYRYVNNQFDAEDAVSETLITYFRKDREFESEEHRKAWLIRVVINESKDLLASRHYDAQINEQIVSGEDEAEPDTSDEVLDLREAIRRLPDSQREVITLYYLQDLSVAEVAEILGKNKNTVAVTLMRARERLKQYLEN